MFVAFGMMLVIQSLTADREDGTLLRAKATPGGVGLACERPSGGEVGEADDSTGRGAASAPQCAGLPSWGRWCNGALPEPPGGLSFDGLAVWSAVF